MDKFLKKTTWRSGCIGACMFLMLNNSFAQSAAPTPPIDTMPPSVIATPAIKEEVKEEIKEAVKTPPTDVAKPAVTEPTTPQTVAKTTVTDMTAKPKVVRPLGKMSLGISGGTNAMFGVDVAYKIIPRIALRLGYNYFAIDKAGVDIADYNLLSIPKGKTAMDIKVDQSNVELLADLSLTKKGGIRLTVGGAYGLKNEYSGKLSYKGSVAINEIVVTSEDMGYMKILYTTKSKISPYIGLGLGRIVPKRRVNLSLDLGTYYRDSPVIKVEATNLLKRNVENEEALNRNLKEFKWYPVANLRLAIKLK